MYSKVTPSYMHAFFLNILFHYGLSQDFAYARTLLSTHPTCNSFPPPMWCHYIDAYEGARGDITAGRTLSISYVITSPSYLTQHPVHSRQSHRISLRSCEPTETDWALTSWGWEIKYQKVDLWWEISVHSIALQITWWCGHYVIIFFYFFLFF